MSWLWDNSAARGTDLLVLLALADFADDDGTNAWPSIETLAKKCRQDRRTVQRTLVKLEDAGLVKVARNAGPGGVNRYVVAMPKPAVEAAPEPSTGGGDLPGVADRRGGVETTGGGGTHAARTVLEPSSTPPTPRQRGARLHPALTTTQRLRRLRYPQADPTAVVRAVRQGHPADRGQRLDHGPLQGVPPQGMEGRVMTDDTPDSRPEVERLRERLDAALAALRDLGRQLRAERAKR